MTDTRVAVRPDRRRDRAVSARPGRAATIRAGWRHDARGRRAGPPGRPRGRRGRPRPGRGSRASPGPARSRRASTSGGGHAGRSCSSQDLLGGQAVVDAAAGVGADVDRHARPRTRPGPPPGSRSRRATHVVGVPGELVPRLLGDVPERPDVDHRGDQRGAPPGHLVDQVAGDRPVPCSTESTPARDHDRHAPPRRTCAPRPGHPAACAAATAAAIVAGVPGRRQVADGPVDPVADQLHPAVAGRGLRGHGGGHLGAVDLDADVAQVALRAARRAGRRGPAAARRARRPAPDTGTASRRPAAPARRRPGPWRPAPGPGRGRSIGRPPGAMPRWQCASTRPGST